MLQSTGVRVSSPRQKVGVTVVRVSSSRSRVTDRVTGRRQGRSGYPEGCATGNRMTLRNWGPLLPGHFLSLTTHININFTNYIAKIFCVNLIIHTLIYFVL